MGGPLNWTDAFFPLGVTRRAFNIGKDLIDPDKPNVAPVQVETPPVPPDLTDEAVQQARIATRKRLLMGSGLQSTFLTGPLGDLSKPPSAAPKASGY